MKKIAIFLSLSIFLSAITPLLGNIRFEKHYSYSNENIIETLQFSDKYAQESSLSALAAKKVGKVASGNVIFSNAKNMITLKIKRGDDTNQNPRVDFTVGNQKITAEIDNDGDERMALDDFIYTKPIFVDTTERLHYSIAYDAGQSLPKNIEIIGLNTSDYSEALALSDGSEQANAETNSNIISRKDW
jgi:hypothetical protein